MERSLLVVLAGILLIAGCSSDGNLATTLPVSNAEPTSTSVEDVAQQASGVEIGKPCSTGGILGQLADGTPVICSGSTKDGAQLDEPVWRETAAGELAEVLSLTALEASAIALVLESAPKLEGSGDHAILIMIEEYRRASTLAAEAGVPIEDAFLNLVEGLRAANGFSYDESIATTVAVLEGVVALQATDEPGQRYARDLLNWYSDGSIYVPNGLISRADPETELRFTDKNWEEGIWESPDAMLFEYYDSCGTLAYNDASFAAAVVEARDDLQESEKANVLGLLLVFEAVTVELCPQYDAVWEEIKEVLSVETWYPTPASLPGLSEQGLEGIYRP